MARQTKTKAKAASGKDWHDAKTIPDSPAISIRSTRSQTKGIPIKEHDLKLPAKTRSPSKRKVDAIVDTPNDSSTLTLTIPAHDTSKPKPIQQNLNKSNWDDDGIVVPVAVRETTVQAKVASTNDNADQLTMTDKTSNVPVKKKQLNSDDLAETQHTSNQMTVDPSDHINKKMAEFVWKSRQERESATKENESVDQDDTRESTVRPVNLHFQEMAPTQAGVAIVGLEYKRNDDLDQYRSLSPTGSLNSQFSSQCTKLFYKITDDKKKKGNRSVYNALNSNELLTATAHIRRDLFRRAKFAPEYLMTKMVNEVLKKIGVDVNQEDADPQKMLAFMALIKTSINSRRSYCIRNITSELRRK